MKRGAIRTTDDLIRFYFNRWAYFSDNIGKITEYGVKITSRLTDITLNRMLSLMDEAWRDNEKN